ncbi:MAG TPA: hypothetical protein VI542_33515 [Candidatus Tectomicrobia bacterium]
MPRMSKTLLSLGVVLTIAGSLTLFGCAATNGQAETEDVNNKSFTFANGTVFHPGLAGAPATLQFTDNANTFTLASAGGTATGNNRFGSCILTVASSTYTPETGPQVNDVMNLNPCSFDSTNFTLTVSNGSNTLTSNPAVARLVNATANDLNDRSFLFFSGEVFNTALVNQVVSIEFSNNANSFELTSEENTDITATGINTFSSPPGACILSVGRSTFRFGTGPQVNDVITLSTCQFNGGTGSLTISNGQTTITSS